MPPLAIRASNITRRYGERAALDGFTLEVPEGGVFGLLGPNGSGKSTFIAMLAAMEQLETGTLEVLDGAPTRSKLKQTATVFQENSGDPLMSTGEYLRFAGSLFGVAAGELRGRIPALLATFGLGQRADDKLATLSGGMRRRLEVVRALLHQPKLLLLDEPTTGVDAEERGILWKALREAAPGVTILLATNDLTEADAVCDRVAFVQAGRVIASGAPAELKAGLRKESVRIGWPAASETDLAQIASWPGTGDVSRQGETVLITTDDASTFVPRLFELAPGAIRTVSIAAASLEDAYFQYVRRRSEGVPA